MSRMVYRNFDEFADRIAGVEGRFVPTAPSKADWWVHGTQVARISLQQLQIGGSSTFAGGGQHDGVTLGLPMMNATRMRIDGSALSDHHFIIMNPEQPFSFAGTGVTRWAGLALPLCHPNLDPRTVEELGAADTVRTRSLLTRLNDLRWLVNRLLCANPAVRIAGPVAAASAEQDISLAIARVLQFSSKEPKSRSSHRRLPRARAITRCLDLIEAARGKPLLVEDLSRAAGMSERTLRTVFLETFGVTPMRLLRMRQLSEARAALLRADPGQTTVAELAEPLGIWDFSLFARNYKALFKEAPSATLRSPANSSSDPRLKWHVCAARTFKAQAIAGERRRRS